MKNSISVNPVKTYEAPNVPTLGETRGNPEFLKTLPLRWKKNAAVITAIGLMGTFVFAGCAETTPEESSAENDDYISENEQANPDHVTTTTPADKAEGSATAPVDGQEEEGVVITSVTPVITTSVTTPPPNNTTGTTTTTAPPNNTARVTTTTPPPNNTARTTTTTAPNIIINPQDENLDFRLHMGGSGFASYIVYMTEQEAQEIIRMRLELEGLRFGAELPDYVVDVEKEDVLGWRRRVYSDLRLYDNIHGVAVAFSNWWDTDDIVREFRNQNNDILFGVFSVPGEYSGIDGNEWYEDENGDWVNHQPTELEIALAKTKVRPQLDENINKQIEKFIEFLRAEGII
jgi:hypothetical protein